MELVKQVCSLELAKSLKELGVKQESLYLYWRGNVYTSAHVDGRSLAGKEGIAAPTVAELGEMLPPGAYEVVRDESKRCWIKYEYCDVGFSANTEADARSKMLIYLIENKLV
jgi:hypothetical protein